MRFMMFMKPNISEDEYASAPSAEAVSAMMAYNEELTKAGVLLALDGLHPSSKGARVQFEGDAKPRVVDGPFTETKELIGGYWIIDVKSRDEAIEWASRVPHVQGDSFEIEVRQVQEMSDFPEDVQAVAELSQTPPEQTSAQ